MRRVRDSSGTNADQWRIGLEAPLSGDLETLGQGMLNGAKLAADQINADGGLSGKDIEIVPIDDGGDPTVGVPAAKKAIADGLDGVVGPYNSGVGIKTLPLYKDAGLVPIRLTSDNDTDGLWLHLAADELPDRPGDLGCTRRLDRRPDGRDRLRPDSELHEEVSRAVRSDLESRGVKVTAFEQVQPGKKRLLGRGGQARLRQSRRDLRRRLLPRGCPDRQGDGGADVAVRPAYSTTPHTTPATCRMRAKPRPATATWSECRRPTTSRAPATYVSEYQDQFGEAPGTWSPYTYDSLNILAYGVKQAGGFGANALTSALEQGEQPEGLDGLGHPRARKRQPQSRHGDGRPGGRPGPLQRRSRLGPSGRRAVLGVSSTPWELAHRASLGEEVPDCLPGPGRSPPPDKQKPPL